MSVKKLLFLTALAFTNHASAVTYYFSANLSEAIGTIPAGTSFTGFFSYDFPQTLTVQQSDPNIPPYLATGFLLNIGITIGSESVFFSNPDLTVGIQLTNNGLCFISTRYGFLFVDGDSFSANASGQGQFLGGEEVMQLGIYLVDTGMTIFPNLELVGDTMRLNNFDYAGVFIHYRTEPRPPFTFPTTTRMSTPTSLVPEPSSLSLLVAGGAVLMAGRRRNRETISPKG